MRKRCLWALIILLLLIVVSVGLVRVFATPKRVEQLANHFLAPHYHIELADDWQWKATGLTLPELKEKNRAYRKRNEGGNHRFATHGFR